jgi:hypothetical protein
MKFLKFKLKIQGEIKTAVPLQLWRPSLHEAGPNEGGGSLLETKTCHFL